MWVWCCVRIKTMEVLGLWSKSQEAHGFGGILAVGGGCGGVIVNPCVGGDDSVGLTAFVLGFVFVWC
uniref:Uncharacterized protein n=1 Tax=Fagus sylvatica TaxID=28930 RepID=A0A2N9I7D1_FAGSY